MEERWLPAVGFEGYYEVSNLGRVKSLYRKITHKNGFVQTIKEKILNGSPDHFGYLCVDLLSNGKRKNAKIHRIVLSAFIGEMPSTIDCRHIDGNKVNNILSNLAYGTRQENVNDTERHGRIPSGENHWNAKISNIDAAEILKSKKSNQELSKKYMVSWQTIYEIKTGRRRKRSLERYL